MLRKIFEWIAKPDCTTVIDISTKESEQTTETFTLDVEINEELLANEDAETIEHIITPELEKRLAEILNDPRFDPHQSEIPDDNKL